MSDCTSSAKRAAKPANSGGEHDSFSENSTFWVHWFTDSCPLDPHQRNTEPKVRISKKKKKNARYIHTNNY